MNHRILLTAIGSFSAYYAIQTLRAHGCFVVGTDIYPAEWHCESSMCNVFRQAPLATDRERYISFLVDLIKEFNITHLNPLTDLEIDVINEYRDTFKAIGVKLCMPSAATLEVARDKYELVRTFEEGIIKVPPTAMTPVVEQSTVNFGVPAIAKPRGGRSSEGLMILNTLDELKRAYDLPNYIIQQMIDGPVICVDYVRDRLGNDFACPRKELLRTKNGAGMTVEILPDFNLYELASYIGKKIDVTGTINIEFIEYNGDYYLIDINPRFSAGVAFTAAAGYDMVMAQINVADSLAIPEPVNLKRAIIQKHFVEVINRQW